MYYSKSIIERIGSDKELALRLDRALSGVKEGVIDYVNNLGDATTRLLYYTSCLTDDYQDECKRLASEDKRFILGIIELIKHKDIVFRMVKIYIETILKNKNENEKKSILEKVVPFTTNYSIKQASKLSLIYAVAKYICYGNKMNAAVQSAFMKKIAGRVGGGILALNAYAMVQRAADSANNLKNLLPLFYNALYMEQIEMMFFLIEPVVMKAGHINVSTASNNDISNALMKMAK